MESEGAAALQRLRSVHAPRYLSPSPELSKDARAAARYLYASLVPFCRKSSAGPPPVDNLLADEAFDAEQIWYQIDLLSRPILPILRRHLHRLEVNPPPSSASAACAGAGAAEVDKRGPDTNDEEESDGEEEREEDGEEEDATEAAAMEEEDDDVAGDYDEEDEESEGAERDVEGNAANTVEDKFLKIKQLEEYLKKDEEKEYGLVPEKKRKIRKEEEDDDESELDDFDDDGGDESELQDMDDDDDEEEEEDEDEMNLAEDAKYEDFFGGNKKRKRNSKRYGEKQSGPNEMLDEDVHDEQNDEIQDDEDVHDERNDAIQDGKNLSTHEKELQKLRQKIEQMEKDNLKPKSWTMQGEVTASKRQKNSALEVDLDFEHNIRPAPVITEEVTASLEDLIRKRVIEGHFDDVQRTPALTSKAPKEHKELDENKSAKGLAEIYEEEYTQKTGLAAAPISTSDELKKEANILFKKICSKLDALSHFHFAPKPVIEEMSIQANVPALAMEEIAPVAVSDAAMLAPEEIFEGKGDIKEQSELTQADRKRRRASKKRKFRARVKSSHKASASASVVTNQSNGS